MGSTVEFATQSARKTPETPQRVSVYDLISAVMDHDNKQSFTVFSRLKEKHTEIDAQLTMYKFPGRGNRDTPVIAMANVDNLMKLVMSSARVSLEKKRKILGDIEYLPVRVYTEVEIHTNVKRALAHMDVRFQYVVGTYRVDMFLPAHNIVVECDEYDHPSYSESEDADRTEYISRELKCRWVRYDPYAEDFNIFDLIDRLYVAIG